MQLVISYAFVNLNEQPTTCNTFERSQRTLLVYGVANGVVGASVLDPSPKYRLTPLLL